MNSFSHKSFVVVFLLAALLSLPAFTWAAPVLGGLASTPITLKSTITVDQAPGTFKQLVLAGLSAEPNGTTSFKGNWRQTTDGTMNASLDITNYVPEF
jgi:hypothetical protein